MRLTQYFLPVLKEDPAEAQIASHRLMLRAGMVQQETAGIYSWLPLGLRVMGKIERIVIEEQEAAGSAQLLMSTLQPAELWEQSGRLNDYGKELLRITDRHDRTLVYGPTNEEQITRIMAQHISSYRDLPKMVFQIQLKMRDEIRPRFGVMRGREFNMKDGYSFDLDEAGARQAYFKMFASYMRTFARMGLKAIPMRADTGPIGGELSHEFIILAETGESEVFCHKNWLDSDALAEDIDYSQDLEPYFEKWTQMYAATDEIHDPADCPVNEADLIKTRGIEVGHIFNFGTKYSKPMGAKVTGPDGKEVAIHSGSYGIGVSRLVGGIIEASHDDKGIIWPEPVAPFAVHLVGLNLDKDETTRTLSENLYTTLRDKGIEVLFDDTAERPGAKLSIADLVGCPWQIIIGPKGAANNMVELKQRRTGDIQELSPDAALSSLQDALTKIRSQTKAAA